MRHENIKTEVPIIETSNHLTMELIDKIKAIIDRLEKIKNLSRPNIASLKEQIDVIENEEVLKLEEEFEDWVNFDQSKLFIAKNNADSPWPAVKEIRVYANKDFVFYYVKYDKESVEEQLAENDALHARICLNTDGEFESGYFSYFLQSYDFIIEGSIGDGAGGYGDFGGSLNQRINGKWESLGGGMVVGAGAGTEYELMIDRAAFDEKAVTGSDPNQPIGDEFYTGMRFYCSGWEEFSNVPNSAVSQGDGSGWGNLLKIVTDK